MWSCVSHVDVAHSLTLLSEAPGGWCPVGGFSLCKKQGVIDFGAL